MTTEMQCDVACSHLPLYVGGDLEAPLAESLAGHLVRCEPCSQRLAGLERARGVLISTRRRTPADGVPVDLWAGIRSQLASEGLLDSGSRPTRLTVSRTAESDGSRHRIHRRLGGLAAAAALMLMVWSPWNDLGPARGPQAPSLGNASAPQAERLAASAIPAADPAAELVPVGLAAPLGGPSASGLRPLQPGDERLAESARPFPSALPLEPTARGGSGWSLVGDRRLR